MITVNGLRIIRCFSFSRALFYYFFVFALALIGLLLLFAYQQKTKMVYQTMQALYNSLLLLQH